ncbi:MAG: Light-sensor Protein kinase [Trichoglossum hirsutum]|nr:MAG: Light-sensor Protein kinase [Trichoglossum hirsutum]
MSSPSRRPIDPRGILRHRTSSPVHYPSSSSQGRSAAQQQQQLSRRRFSLSEFDSSQSDADAEEKVYPIRSIVAFSPLTRSYSTSSIASRRDAGLTTPTASKSPVSSQRGSRRTSLAASRSPFARSAVSPAGRRRSGSPHASGKRKWDTYREPELQMDLAKQRQHLSEGSRKEPRTPTGPGPRTSDFRAVAADRHGDDEGGFITARFTHLATEGGHSVITGRGGSALTRCEDEPIRIPGAVQGFGLLVAVRLGEGHSLVVRIVSENSELLIGYKPNDLFTLPSFCNIMSVEQAEIFLSHIDFVQHEDYSPDTSGPHVFPISILTPGGEAIRMWCAVHTFEENGELIICEFEHQDDQLFPIRSDEEEQPDVVDTLKSNPTQEDFDESTIDTSKPFRAPPRGRGGTSGEVTQMEVYDVMSQVHEMLSAAPNLEAFVKILTSLAKQLTGFHRVMVYRFDESYNGNVVAELVDPRYSRDLYKGLRFPASDIPKQARELYKINKVRLLYDRELETARLVCRTMEDLEKPLNLTYSYLRAMSPIHIKYLNNMGVRASMSITVTAFGDLWGLIACHAHGSKGMRVDFPMRRLCRVLGDVVSRNVERLLHVSRINVQQLIKVSVATTPSGCIVATSEDLLKLFDADFGLLSIRDATSVLGKLEQSQESLAMLEYLRLRGTKTVFSTEDITKDFPDLQYAPGFSVIAGLLLIPLSITGQDFLVFFRRAELQTVKWGGNPYERGDNDKASLEPRKSFRIWTETISNRSRDWTPEQVECAAMLSLVYGRFIDVWKAKEATAQRRQFKRLLLANASHRLRTPLNAIINYLEIAMEGSLDEGVREDLSRSYSASKFMICVINDLLDLTTTEGGPDLTTDEVFDLPATIRDAVDSFKDDFARKNLDHETIEHEDFPRFVRGDQWCVRQIVSNLVANAVQHTTTGGVTAELWPVLSDGDGADDGGGQCVVEITIEDTGKGMSPEKADALFRDLEQVESDEGMAGVFSRGDNDTTKATLGLDLAVVARIVSIMQGQLRLKSGEGKGSRFVVRLPFSLPKPGESTHASGAAGVASPTEAPLSQYSQLGDTEGSVGSRTSLSPHPRGVGWTLQSPPTTVTATPTPPTMRLSVLVAEDDPINAKVMKRRLEKMGHKVHVTLNGEECARWYKEGMDGWDVILMDIQMPIVDGIAATKIIRNHERQQPPPQPRIPILAVSASLQESHRGEYVADGLDGWILKPVNFRRLEALMSGVKEGVWRKREVYREGRWDEGGWFSSGGDEGEEEGSERV